MCKLISLIFTSLITEVDSENSTVTRGKVLPNLFFSLPYLYTLHKYVRTKGMSTSRKNLGVTRNIKIY